MRTQVSRSFSSADNRGTLFERLTKLACTEIHDKFQFERLERMNVDLIFPAGYE
jgi:hypothetical protein